MKFAGFTLALAGIFAGSALGQAPTVGGLLNNYSFTLPGLPNYGIARGSIFDIFGTNLAATTIPLQGPPLQTTLGGVTINVTVNGTTTHPLFYFLSALQIAAVLPSATPVGTGTISVTTGAGTSADFPITVVEGAFGLLTVNNGTGPVAGYNASNNGAFMSSSAAANPGDILELWGTGLGPVADDATGGPVSDPIEVDIGGIAAEVLYHGRSSYAGLDQINVKVPAGVSGCNVSVVVVTGAYVSNFATLPVAASGRACSDTFSPLSASVLDEITRTGTFSSGVISLSKTTTPGTTIGGITVGGGTTDSAFASFAKITAAQFNAGAYSSVAGGFASVGSCLVSFFSTSGTGSQTPPPAFQVTYLNAGPKININGPDGLLAMPLQTIDGISYYSAPDKSTIIPASGGAFTFDNGSGGTDVGAFTAALQMATPLVWTDMNSISTVTRQNGITVHWTGGDPGTFVNVTGTSLGSVDGSSSNFIVGTFTCQAPATAGSFTVPSPVLLALPPSFVISAGGVSLSTSTLTLSNVTAPVTFSAPNLNVGLVEASVADSITVTYQ